MPPPREESGEELRQLFRQGFSGPQPGHRFNRKLAPPKKAVRAAATLRWGLGGVALVAVFAVLTLSVHPHRFAPVRPTGHPQGKPPLPHGFQTVGSLLKALGPVVQRGSKLRVLLPRSLPVDNLPTGHVWDAIYHTSAQAYDLSIFAGPPLPVNSPKVGEGGNAAFLVMVRGAPTEADLNTEQFGPLTAWQPNAAQGAVSLGSGIVATNFVAGAGAQTTTSVSWSEDGWNFVIPPTSASNHPDQLAAGLAKSAAGLHLPGSFGTAVFTIGSDAPSLAVFRSHGTWYAVWANSWRAATYTSAMAPAK